jgi:SAM-dependent methyltransferase
MTEIEHRVEAPRIVIPDYSGRVFTDEEIAAGKHRAFVGGVWDTHGKTQLDFLISQGLSPSDQFLDIGCGALRAGRHIAAYLEPGHYHGIDANRSLIQAGYDVELDDALRERLPAANLRANDRFDGDFGVQYDVALAQSVFTHVSLNHIRLCLYRTAKVMKPGGKFFATFFEQPTSTPIDRIVYRRKGGRPLLNEANVYWYYRKDLAWAASYSPWRMRYIGDWGHPAGQRMVEFTRLADAPPAGSEGGARQLPTVVRTRTFVARGLRSVARRVDVR